MVRTMVAMPALQQAQERPLGHPGQQVGHEVGAAALPTGAGKHRGDGLLQSLVGIGYDQFHPAEALDVQRAQEGQPEGAVLAGAYVHVQDIPLTGAVHASGHHHADVDDPPALTDLLGESASHT